MSRIERIEIKLPVLKCIRCRYRWHSKTNTVPKVCPNCHSPYWSTPRRNKRGAGRPRKNNK